jgi:hypothetical protein
MVSGNNDTIGTGTVTDNNEEIIGDYRPGSIQRVKLQNFLTHSNVEFRPGPRYVLYFFVFAINNIVYI